MLVPRSSVAKSRERNTKMKYLCISYDLDVIPLGEHSNWDAADELASTKCENILYVACENSIAHLVTQIQPHLATQV